MGSGDLLKNITGIRGAHILESLYGLQSVKEEQRRYTSLLKGMSPQGGFPVEFSDTAGDFRIFSAPGRTELGGNHTDHNRGRVLAASIQMDAVAVVAPRDDKQVFLRSPGFPDVRVNLEDSDGLSPKPEEQGTTEALVRGIAAGFTDRGVELRGFCANAASTVLHGSGLSSSAAIEILVAKIFDGLYGGGKFLPIELAKICQKAENVFLANHRD
jgi:galactokinase